MLEVLSDDQDGESPPADEGAPYSPERGFGKGRGRDGQRGRDYRRTGLREHGSPASLPPPCIQTVYERRVSAPRVFLEFRRLARRLHLRPLRLVRLLGRLVVLQRLRRIDVAERGVRRHELLRGGQLVALGEHGAERLDLH